MDRQIDIQKDRHSKKGQTNGQTDTRIDGQIEEQICRQTDVQKIYTPRQTQRAIQADEQIEFLKEN